MATWYKVTWTVRSRSDRNIPESKVNEAGPFARRDNAEKFSIGLSETSGAALFQVRIVEYAVADDEPSSASER